MSKEETRIRQLMALATGSPYSEEGRTAALAAVRLIERHGLQGLLKKEEPIGLGEAPHDERLERELRGLREEIARLRAEREEPASTQAPGSALLALDAAAKAAEIERLRSEVAYLRALPRAPAVALHVVQPGESPQRIARAYTGSPARAGELLTANPRKPRLWTQWGWTFASLHVGERLRLPTGWV